MFHKSLQFKTQTSLSANNFPLGWPHITVFIYPLPQEEIGKRRRGKSIIVELSCGPVALSARYRLGCPTHLSKGLSKTILGKTDRKKQQGCSSKLEYPNHMSFLTVWQCITNSTEISLEVMYKVKGPKGPWLH